MAKSNEQIALEAKSYAQFYIKKGCTQLQTNAYDQSQKKALLMAMDDLRANMLEFEHSEELAWIESNIKLFYKSVENSKKFSLGNCAELAMLAMNYIAHNTDNNAEFYNIINGDHMFVVIGRQMNSDPSDPTTWGDQAFFCDPWSNLVYPSRDYLTKLHDHYISGDVENYNYVNNIRPFDPHTQQLMPVANLNTAYIRSFHEKNVDFVQALFIMQCSCMSNALTTLKQNLQTTAQRLKEKYPTSNERIAVIEKLITNLEEITGKITNSLNNKSELMQGNYLEIKSNFSKNLLNLRKSYNTTVNISQDDKNTLNTPQRFKKIMRYFNCETRAMRDTRKAFEDVDRKIKITK